VQESFPYASYAEHTARINTHHKRTHPPFLIFFDTAGFSWMTVDQMVTISFGDNLSADEKDKMGEKRKREKEITSSIEKRRS
jgi:hypothetical protein